MRLRLSQIQTLLAIMLEVATEKGRKKLSALQSKSIRAVYTVVFNHQDKPLLRDLPQVTVNDFQHEFPEKKQAEYALRFLVITALMDGEINPEKIKIVFEYAKAVNLNPHYLLQLKKTLDNDLPWLIKDINQKNLESFDIFPNLKDEKDIDNWLFPYRGDKQDPALVKRYEALSQLPPNSFGYHIWQQFKRNNYKFPGEEEGANYAFIMPHDSIHVLSGYNTSPYGELLVSVFTSTMLDKNPISGHVIPVIYSFYLGIKLNDLAGAARVTIDPYEFWEAWYRGSQMQVNLFAHGWSLWDVAEVPLVKLRQLYCVLPTRYRGLANAKI
ncbi:hypothetical protein ACQUW5_09610 [Legionella sp. CNM-1927-20]|uniref:hypothetical protein n=1 Tax=Legionella sp. CNM-1927-20 TaxID=3422221 RepID=UPI00403A85A6